MRYRRFQGGRDCLLLHLIILFIFFGCFTPTTIARVWHVKAKAFLAGDGSLESPFLQIQSASAVAYAGDTVLVHGGTYYETVKPIRSGQAHPDGTIQYIYYIAAPNEIATIKAKNDFCFLLGEIIAWGQVNKKDYIWIEGFHLTGGHRKITEHGAAIRTFSDYGVFLNNYMYNNDMGIFSEGNGLYEESNNNRGNFIAHNVISRSREAGVRLKRSSENDVVFNLLYNNGMVEPNGAVTFYCGISNRIINNTFWNNRGGAVTAYNGTNSDSCIACSYSEVRDNVFARPDSGLLMQVQRKTALDTSSTFSYNLFWGPDPDIPLVEWGMDELGQGGFT